jgi:hypothetical protein
MLLNYRTASRRHAPRLDIEVEFSTAQQDGRLALRLPDGQVMHRQEWDAVDCQVEQATDPERQPLADWLEQGELMVWSEKQRRPGHTVARERQDAADAEVRPVIERVLTGCPFPSGPD